MSLVAAIKCNIYIYIPFFGSCCPGGILIVSNIYGVNQLLLLPLYYDDERLLTMVLVMIRVDKLFNRIKNNLHRRKSA